MKTLEFLVENVEAWTKHNTRWAVEAQTAEQEHLARLLRDAVRDTPATIRERRRLLRAAMSNLDAAP